MPTQGEKAEELIRENLEVLKGLVDVAVSDQEIVTGQDSVDALINDRVRVSKDVDDSEYRVDLNDNFGELSEAEQGETTFSSVLFFNGKALKVTRAVIDLARVEETGKQGGYERKITKSRLPGFVASVTAQVMTEAAIATE